WTVTPENCHRLTGMQGMGAKTVAKIREIVTTGRLKRVDDALADPRMRTMAQFLGVHGAGPSTARRWYDELHITSMEQLRARAAEPGVLTVVQAVGVRYYEDLQQRIPRAECERIAAIIRAECQAVSPGCL